MNSNSFGRTLSDWLHEEAEHRVPDHLGEVLVLTAASRQRPWWSSLQRWLPMDTTLTRRLAPALRPAPLILALLLMLVVAAGVILVGTRQPRLPAPYGPAANGFIVYSSGGDIKIADEHGDNARVLIGGAATDLAAVLSHDGTRLAYFRKASSARYEVMIASAAGTDIRPLTSTSLLDPSSLDWSPDGSQLVVLHRKVGKPTLSIVGTDGSQAIRDLPLGNVLPERASWRLTDGREVAFRGHTTDGVSVYAIGADGTGLHTVAPVIAGDFAYLGMRLSPDATRITYWHNLPADTPEGAKSEVHVLDLVTNQDTRIGYDPESRHELLPKFSPDGKSVLFVRFPPDQDASVMIAAADGSGVVRKIGPSQYWDGNPTFEFSPDGRKVVVTFGPGRRLQVIDVADGTITTGEFADLPDWQRLAP